MKHYSITQFEEKATTMKHLLFEETAEGSECEGEQFIVGAATIEEAYAIAYEYGFEEPEYQCELSDEEAEASGLDEY